jgi:hypothetical protein
MTSYNEDRAAAGLAEMLALAYGIPDDEVAERRYTIQGEDSDCPTVQLMP